MSLRIVLAVALLALLVFNPGGPVMGAGLSASLEELRSLLLRESALNQTVSGPNRNISPDLGRYQEELRQNADRLETVRNAILASLNEELDRGEYAGVTAYVGFVQGLSAADGARRGLATLAAPLSAKLRFASAGLSGREKAAAQATLETLKALGAAAPAATPAAARASSGRPGARGAVPIYIAFHWHMHQPIYWPYEDLNATQNRGVYSYSLHDLFMQRTGAYTDWPRNAVKAAADAGLPSGGAQVSFSGSLIEDLDAMARVRGDYANWPRWYREARKLRTAGGNPRLELVAFGYHHPLMALIGYEDIRHQIAAHRQAIQRTFGDDVAPSKGIFPPENAFAEWMIPALVDEGLEWAFVDNIHFTRACRNYPWVRGENLYPPNASDQRNPDPGDWLQLNGLWAPSKVSPWANRPHYVVYTDPATGKPARTPEGKEARLIAVPTDRYMGNEDGRGGFGALNYETVMSQLEAANQDPAHPLLVVLHHDGDNYGGGSYGYYNDNFRRFVDWVKGQPGRFVCTTIQDYLDRFPPAKEDVIHVEPGSWSGADNGDPEFLKWNGDPDAATGYSPDRNSWGVMTAARNLVAQAQAAGVADTALEKARRYLAVAQTSCYEYWDGTEMWDSHPTRACNEVAGTLLPLLEQAGGSDGVPPALYQPQRQPYNPGGFEWGTQAESSDFTVWTYAYDHGGLASVRLRYRVHPGRTAPEASDLALAGGEWLELPMPGKSVPARTNPMPAVKAQEFAATVKGVKDALVDYQVVAVDAAGNKVASPLLHVYVGKGAGGAGAAWEPETPSASDRLTIFSDRAATLHWGVNGWTLPQKAYWPAGTTPWADGKAVDTAMLKVGQKYQAVLGPFSDPAQVVSSLNFVLRFADDTWGKDTTIKFAAPPKRQ